MPVIEWQTTDIKTLQQCRTCAWAWGSSPRSWEASVGRFFFIFIPAVKNCCFFAAQSRVKRRPTRCFIIPIYVHSGTQKSPQWGREESFSPPVVQERRCATPGDSLHREPHQTLGLYNAPCWQKLIDCLLPLGFAQLWFPLVKNNPILCSSWNLNCNLELVNG